MLLIQRNIKFFFQDLNIYNIRVLYNFIYIISIKFKKKHTHTKPILFDRFSAVFRVMTHDGDVSLSANFNQISFL